MPSARILEFFKKATQTKNDYAPIFLKECPSEWLTVKHIDISLEPLLYQKRILEWGNSVWQVYKPVEKDLKEVFTRILSVNG
jgi:hypothetical protein